MKTIKLLLTAILFINFFATNTLQAQCQFGMVHGFSDPMKIITGTFTEPDGDHPHYWLCENATLYNYLDSHFVHVGWIQYFMEKNSRLTVNAYDVKPYTTRSRVYAKSGTVITVVRSKSSALKVQIFADTNTVTIIGSPNDYTVTHCASGVTFDYFMAPAGGCISTEVLSDSNPEASMNVYPNPANQLVNLSWEKPYSGTIHLMDALGNLVVKKDVVSQNKTTINTLELPSGIYFLAFPGEPGSGVKKIIVNH